MPLNGVLTVPESQKHSTVAAILLNSGVMHRVGACRASVKIARALAGECDLQSVRFDFSGIGDSAPRSGGGVDFNQAAINEVIEVMDYLQRTRGVEHFILYGLCSGALVSCHAGVRDERVAAIAQVDGCCYPTSKSYASYYFSRLWSVNGWRMRLRRWLGLKEEEGSHETLMSNRANFEIPEFSDDPGHEAVTQQLHALMQRDVQLHCIFTGQEPYYRYHNQFRECFKDVDFKEHLSVDYFPFASHIFSEPLYQQQLIEGLVNWVKGLEIVKNCSDKTTNELPIKEKTTAKSVKTEQRVSEASRVRDRGIKSAM